MTSQPPSQTTPNPPPSHILVVGAGVFGLSTILSLLRRAPFSEASRITLLDSSPELPNPVGSSVDTSRIVRPDYASAPYARLMREAQHLWRQTASAENDWGADGRYTETGVVYVVDKGKGGAGEKYLASSLNNVRDLAKEDPSIGGAKGEAGIKELNSSEEIAEVMGGGILYTGDYGFLNEGSGWADAEKCVRFALNKLQREGVEKGKLTIMPGQRVQRLLYGSDGRSVTGVQLETGDHVLADLTILATGAWTPTLVDLRGRAVATGQVLAYIDITAEEEAQLGKLPTLLDHTNGTFIITPRDRVLKVARHGYGYRNPTTIPHPGPKPNPNLTSNHQTQPPSETSITVSIPMVSPTSTSATAQVPAEGLAVVRQALRTMVRLRGSPELAERAFTRARLCWYCDTTTGDFLIAPHPELSNLIVATGGSGHGFKFFPIIGEKIVDLISDHLGVTVTTITTTSTTSTGEGGGGGGDKRGVFDPELQHLWRWRSDAEIPGRTDQEVECLDGSRGGRRGMIWAREMGAGE